MRKIFFPLLLVSLLLFTNACQKNKEPLVDIITTEGTITIKLYKNTPQHRDNFIKLVKGGYYDSLLFHRVVKDFMIQSGDPDSKTASHNRMLSDGGPGYTLPAEIHYPTYFHKRGALCAARLNNYQNPEKRSSGSQFYIVLGEKFTNVELDSIEKDAYEKKITQIMQKNIAIHRPKINEFSLINDKKTLATLQDSIAALAAKEVQETSFFTFTKEQRKIYTTLGGTPNLDKEYTVFGEVVSGWEVLDKIAQAPIDRNQRPVNEIRIIGTNIR